MLRQLLTLIAVISGLTLAAEPVRAADADVVSMVQATDQADSAVIGAHSLQPAEAPASHGTAMRPSTHAASTICQPTVQLQADRAHE